MCSGCQERRSAIRDAAVSKETKKMMDAVRFVGKSAVKDLARAMNLRRNGVKGVK